VMLLISGKRVVPLSTTSSSSLGPTTTWTVIVFRSLSNAMLRAAHSKIFLERPSCATINFLNFPERDHRPCPTRSMLPGGPGGLSCRPRSAPDGVRRSARLSRHAARSNSLKLAASIAKFTKFQVEVTISYEGYSDFWQDAVNLGKYWATTFSFSDHPCLNCQDCEIELVEANFSITTTYERIPGQAANCLDDYQGCICWGERKRQDVLLCYTCLIG
jgi:hypothetical protein